ncbi:hypothetical protein HK102_008126, partial [Quaeritorhiza haematococci]
MHTPLASQFTLLAILILLCTLLAPVQAAPVNVHDVNADVTGAVIEKRQKWCLDPRRRR